MRRFWRRGPRGAGGGGGAITQRPGLAIEGRRRLLAHAMDEPHPTPMRTPAALLRRTGRLCRGQCPGRSRYSWVPGPWPFDRASGSLLERGVQLGRAHGRGGSSGDCSCSRQRCGGGRVDFGRVPRHGTRLPWDSCALSPFDPPTHLRGAALIHTAVQKKGGHGRRPIKAAGCRGCGRGHPNRTRGPLTTGCHRCGWPRRLPFGVGSPAVPRLSASRSG